MVDAQSSENLTRLVLTPNRSMSWHLNKCLIAVVSLWMGLIALGIAMVGAWPVLPFLGLELATLWGGLWYTCWKLRIQEVISTFPIGRFDWSAEFDSRKRDCPGNAAV